jgi:hypothetical protein
MQVAGVGKVCLISVLDVVSRWHRSRATRVWIPPIPLWKPSNSCSRAAELSRGLPQRISFDHGTVCDENPSPSPFPTRLHLWLLADGASTSASRASAVPPITPRPGRTHQTMTLQALRGQRWSDQPALWAGLDARRTMRESAYSQRRPPRSRSLASLCAGLALGSLLSARMGSRDARPPSGLCVPGDLSLVSAHTGQWAARPWRL